MIAVLLIQLFIIKGAFHKSIGLIFIFIIKTYVFYKIPLLKE